MVNFNFTDGASHFGYGPGVNAANLTSSDIANANARSRPQPKATQGDAGINPDTRSGRASCGVTGPNYSSWTREELRKAVFERGIKSEKVVARMSKVVLVDTLKKADENPEFHRFSDLPAELRNEVYKLAVADLNPKGLPRVRPASPNICRVSKQTRSESLPLFLNSIDQNIIVSWVPAGTKSRPRQKAVLCKEYYTYFENARKRGWLQHIRSFHFRIMERPQTPGGSGKTKIDPNARYNVRFANMMESVKTWRRAEKDVLGRVLEINDKFVPKLKAGIASTINGSGTTMSGRKFNAMIRTLLDAVDQHYAE